MEYCENAVKIISKDICFFVKIWFGSIAMAFNYFYPQHSVGEKVSAPIIHTVSCSSFSVISNNSTEPGTLWQSPSSIPWDMGLGFC